MTNNNRHILIAEDDCKLLWSMRFALRSRGYRVTIVTNGLSALKKILNKTMQYDLLITDIKMPLCNGIQLLDEINQRKIAIPVIAISAYDDSHTISVLTDKGCESFISKPFSSTELNNCIENIFNHLTNTN